MAEDLNLLEYDLNTFQSFFYWNCLGGGTTGKLPPIWLDVSILLLLELPWWPSRFKMLTFQSWSFNPSFTGIALVAIGGIMI